MTIDAVQMLIYRAGLVIVLAYGVVDSLGVIKKPDFWHLHGLARIPGMTRFAEGILRRGITILFFISAVCFLLKLAPLYSSIIMTSGFLIITSLHHSVPWTGYSVETEDGRVVRQIYHHLHLSGLCALAAVSAEILSAILNIPRSSVTAADEADAIFLVMVWAAIGAHYFISALSKLKTRGLGWVDCRLFPYYITLLRSCAYGDTGLDQKPFLATKVLQYPNLGLWMLWIALFCELGSSLYPFNNVARALIGIGLIGFHLMSSRVLYITFYENYYLLLTFTFNHTRLIGWITGQFEGAVDPVDFKWTAFITFIVIIAVSFVVREYLFPFSVLAMFTSPYRSQYVIRITDSSGEAVFPMPSIAGGTTSGISREFTVHLADGGTPQTFIEKLETRIENFKGAKLPPHYDIVISTIDVEADGSVRLEEDVYKRPAKGIKVVEDDSANQ